MSGWAGAGRAQHAAAAAGPGAARSLRAARVDVLAHPAHAPRWLNPETGTLFFKCKVSYEPVPWSVPPPKYSVGKAAVDVRANAGSQGLRVMGEAGNSQRLFAVFNDPDAALPTVRMQSGKITQGQTVRSRLLLLRAGQAEPPCCGDGPRAHWPPPLLLLLCRPLTTPSAPASRLRRCSWLATKPPAAAPPSTSLRALPTATRSCGRRPSRSPWARRCAAGRRGVACGAGPLRGGCGVNTRHWPGAGRQL